MSHGGVKNLETCVFYCEGFSQQQQAATRHLFWTVGSRPRESGAWD